MSELWQLGASETALGDRSTDLRCAAIPDRIEQAVGTVTPIDPVVA